MIKLAQETNKYYLSHECTQRQNYNIISIVTLKVFDIIQYFFRIKVMEELGMREHSLT